jgi:ubiquinone/menaquinone biosynthesis C-methylase UbiE
MEKYDLIGKTYNQTRRADPYLLSRMRALLELKDGCAYLDIGCGTGNYTSQLHSPQAPFIGIDPSETMLARAREQNPNVRWELGAVEDIPLPNSCVHGCLASLTTHHWSSLARGFGEVRRVMHDGGKVVIFTTTPEQTAAYWLSRYFPQAMEKSVQQLPSLAATQHALESSGFEITQVEPYSVSNDLQDFFLYSGKFRPEMYFDPIIRSGISTFSSLADVVEIEMGLEKLRRDINSGAIYEIIRKSENDLGDYLFIVAKAL